MSSASDAAREGARQVDGKFGTYHLPKAAAGDLAAAPISLTPPLTPRDVEILAANKGRFENGYTPEDADKVLSQFESVEVAVYWDYYDEEGMGGDSFFAGHASALRNASLADERLFSDEAWEFLSDPESDIDPERIASLLAEPANINGGEMYTFSIGMGEQHAFAYSGSSTCNFCSDPYDHQEEGASRGLCTSCSSMVDAHFEGKHEAWSGPLRDDCPECQSHGS